MNFLDHSFLFCFTTPPSVNQMIYNIYSLNGIHLFFFLITKKEQTILLQLFYVSLRDCIYTSVLHCGNVSVALFCSCKGFIEISEIFLLCDLSRNVVLNYIKISLGEEKGLCVCVCFFTRNALCFNNLCTQTMALSQYIEKVCTHGLIVRTRLGLLLSGFFMGICLEVQFKTPSS